MILDRVIDCMFSLYGLMLTSIPFGLEPLESCAMQYCSIPCFPFYEGLVEKPLLIIVLILYYLLIIIIINNNEYLIVKIILGL